MPDTTTSRDLVIRLNRIEGQIAALRRSLEEGTATDCTQTLHQLKAATNALKRFGEAYARQYAQRCLKQGVGSAHTHKSIEQIISAAFTLS